MGRTVADVARLLSVMAGPDPRDPGCYPSDPSVFTRALGRDVRGVRVAWCLDLGGLPLDRRVREALDRQRTTLEAMGCVVEDACPDLRDADSIFLTIRRWRSAAVYGGLLEARRPDMKPEAVEEIELGLSLTGADVARAMTLHGQLLERVRRFQDRFEFLACAVSQVPPFEVTWDWPKAIDGVVMDGYVAWMKSAYWMTTTFRPAASVPAGFTSDGLPVGLQIVGRHRDDRGVLEFAHAFEQATLFGRTRPML
jgi:amidase